MKKRIVAVLLTLIMTFSIAAAPAGAAVEQQRKSTSIVDLLTIWENGYAMPDLGNIIEMMFKINQIMYTVTGLPVARLLP